MDIFYSNLTPVSLKVHISMYTFLKNYYFLFIFNFWNDYVNLYFDTNTFKYS